MAKSCVYTLNESRFNNPGSKSVFNETKLVMPHIPHFEHHIFATGGGIVYPDSRYAFKRIIRAHMFEYVCSGKGQISAGSTGYNLSAGDFVYAAKGTYLDYSADRANPYKKLWFAVDGDLASELCRCYFKDKPLVVCSFNAERKILDILELLEKDPDYYRKLLHMVIDLIADSQLSEKNFETTFPERMRDFIESNPLQNGSLDVLSKQFNLSKRQIIRIFKKNFDMTPIAFANEIRHKNACRLLIGTDYPIGMISNMLGFCDQSYFSCDFKRRENMYPSEYRERATQLTETDNTDK